LASSEELAERIRAELADRTDISERKMFGGNGFMLAGNLCVSAQRNGNMLVRVNPEQSDDLSADPHVETMVMRGREMRGWLTVDSAALDHDATLREWLGHGVAYASSLPPK
jgi:TfoX/Sxy family transcriptional regulator of competence genes